MQLLIVSATTFEIKPFHDFLSTQCERIGDWHFKNDDHETRILITGVGMMSTAFALGHVFAKYPFQLAINAGIAGAFDPALQIGDVVQVVSEQFGDLGVEERDGSFTDVFELGLLPSTQPPFANARLLNPTAGHFGFLPACKGLTVNKVHGSEASITAIREKYGAEVETMEGAAFFYACLIAGVPFLQVRAISNHVRPRNREEWDLPKAIKNLNEVLVEMWSALKTG